MAALPNLPSFSIWALVQPVQVTGAPLICCLFLGDRHGGKASGWSLADYGLPLAPARGSSAATVAVTYAVFVVVAVFTL
jgi:hypothetical protein